MSEPKVLIIGCGIAGPVLAVLLKRKGYSPVVFEKVRQLGDAGASLMLMPNGMKVLNLVGVADEVYSGASPLDTYQDFKGDGTKLGMSDLPKSYRRKYGQCAVGVRRTRLNLMMKDLLLRSGIEVHEGWGLKTIEEVSDSVLASFTNGQTMRGSFLIGCDGIKAATRAVLLDKHQAPQPPPTYTGLTQISGLSPMPKAFTESSMRNWYGEGVHVIAYPLSAEQISWAVTVPETEEQSESWGLCSPEEMQQVKQDLSSRLDEFDSNVVEMVQSAERILTFGLFDRETLAAPDWYSRRIVLCGDAAHPTSPHLGQGANQALEDCYHLSDAFPDLKSNESGSSIPGDLEENFSRYAEKRQPRTATLVRGARAVGEKRVVTGGKEACERRDQAVVAEWQDTEAIALKFDGLCREPFNALAATAAS
ncbi:FAD-dependent urate hydroxylase [subsurface metagenome]